VLAYDAKANANIHKTKISLTVVTCCSIQHCLSRGLLFMSQFLLMWSYDQQSFKKRDFVMAVVIVAADSYFFFCLFISSGASTAAHGPHG